MDKKKDPIEHIILEDIRMEAEMIKKEVTASEVGQMPPEIKEKIKKKLHEKMEEREKEKIYAKLSEEDRQALELGREMMRKQNSPEPDDKIVYFKKKKKMYLALAAVMVLVFAMGVTSMGGPERVVQMMKMLIGDREIVRVDTDDNYVVDNDREDEAYQMIEDVFGVEPVKLAHQLEGMKFVFSEIDKELQTALLIYEYEGENISYHISSHHTDSSWGIDIEDALTDKYVVEKEKCNIMVQEYEKPESRGKRYFAKYTYDGLEYCLMGALNRSDFEELVEGIKFF